MRNRRSRGVKGFVERHRVAFTFLALFLMTQPARPDDRQLLQANSGANTNVLLILDSSYSMNNEFSDSYRMPAFMDDFIYPEGTTVASGSKFAIAKSVLRQVMTNTSGVNWAFSYYRNPDQAFGAADTSANANAGDPPPGYPIGGATTAGQHLENGGVEWLYFANTLDNGNPISTVFAAADWPDVQQGRFLQLGHKVMRLYGTLGQPEVPPYTVNPTSPDSRPPYPGPIPGGWRGAFGPHGLNEGLVVYRSATMPGHELRMQVVSGNYADPALILQVDEYGPPALPTSTPSNTPTQTNTPSNTPTASPTKTSSPTPTSTATNTASPTATSTFTRSNTPTSTATATPTSTSTATGTATKTFTPSSTNTPSNTPTATSTFTATATRTASNTPSQTSTASNTPTRTSTFTPSRTFTASSTNTPSATRTPTNTFTPTPTFTRTFTATATFTATRTFTPSNTNTPTATFTATRTFTATNTATRTNTPSNTATRTATFTASNTNTPSNTRTPSNTATATNTATQTFTPTNTATQTATFTATRTFTASNTATNTATRTPSNTATATNTPSNTASRTPTNTATRTFTASFTATPTSTATSAPTATRTPTLVPTLPGGAFPQRSLMPAIANWLAPVVRGLFAWAPPPAGACPGIPSSYTGGSGPGSLQCAPCPYDASRLCSFVDVNGDGIIDAGDDAPAVLKPLPSSPTFMRGFDDPQADPDPTLVLIQSVRIQYIRGDQYDLPPAFTSNDSSNGNPPWGSCPSTSPGCPASPDNDADGQVDTVFTSDRHNQGAYAAIYDKERPRPVGQFPSDALAGPSCPLGIVGCDPYVQDCGGYAHFNTDAKGFPGAAPKALGPPDAASPAVYPSNPPASPQDWPVVPFKREWLGTDYPGGTSPEASIKRLLRFSSSLVSYDFSATPDRAYTLEEDAKEVVVTAACTPIAGVLLDAYNYFVKSVFPPPTGSAAPDPAIDCRNYIIVFVTDGHDEAGSDPCTGGPTGNGPSGDLGQVLLPESSPGRRAAANALDPSVRVKGIPVYVVGLNTNPAFFPALNCVATNSGGQLFAATDRTTLQAALESILDFKRSANFFASPSLPAFAGGFGDTAQIGAVIPSHLNPNGELSSWSIWTGTVKSYQLDSNGQIPVVTGSAPTATPTETPGGPTATPIVSTPTPTPTPIPGTNTYADETDPDNTNAAARRPVWSAGRVLGYTDPKADLAAGANSSPATPGVKAPAISVWPGRKMVWAQGATVPLTRSDFLPNSGSCSGMGSPGSCFSNLITAMGLDWTNPTDQNLSVLTVQFLRGGASAFGSRDEILNNASIRPATVGVIGPNTGQEQKFSYFYQDDAPAPGDPPQDRTDGGGGPPAGYAHKLGDIFHSEPLLVEPPRYFQFLSSNLTPRTSSSTFGEPYLTFAQRQAKRRKVLYVGANDGFLHAFDSAVFGRDTSNFPTTFDLGTGREIFAYAPRAVMGSKFPNLLNFPPLPQYFVDGSAASADVFIDPVGSPTASERVWRTVLVGGLRQGGNGYYALDITQPDDIDTNTASSTFGEIVGNKDASPGCLDGSGASCTAGGVSNRQYPTIMWEFTDGGSACSDGCNTPTAPAMGESWSRPVVGRIKVYDPSSTTADASGFDDRYVAIFGGGEDPSFTPGDRVLQKLPKGRALYMVDVETGAILFKAASGVAADGSGGFITVPFAPMPSSPAVADYNDDGYLDVIYIGDVNGRMWRVDLTPSVPNSVGIITSGQAHGYVPYMLFNGCGVTGDVVCTNTQPIFFEPGIVYLGGSANPPGLGIAFGTGNRADLARPNTQTQSFYYVVDNGQTSTTFVRSDLHDLSTGGAACPLPYNPVTCAGAVNGFVLDYGSNNEKTTSTVFSTQGYLSLITFTPDSVSPCATNGSSFRYRFFFLTGQGGYGTTGTYADYQQSLGTGMAAATQSTSPQGDIIDTVLFSGGALRQEVTPGSVHTIERNWKEQQ